MTVRQLVIAFVAGFLAVPIFHQGVYWLMYTGGLVPNPPWSMTPVPPFGVPQILSISFFGGLWGIVLAFVLKRVGGGARFWLTAAVFGGVALTAVALLVVFPLKGIPVKIPEAPIGGFILNAAWGLGTALMMRLAKAI